MTHGGHVSAVVAACSGVVAWLPTVELAVRLCGGLVAIAAGIVSILVHLHNRKAKK